MCLIGDIRKESLQRRIKRSKGGYIELPRASETFQNLQSRHYQAVGSDQKPKRKILKGFLSFRQLQNDVIVGSGTFREALAS